MRGWINLIEAMTLNEQSKRELTEAKRATSSPSLLYHGSDVRIVGPYRPLTHFGTEEAARARALAVARRNDTHAWIHPVRVMIHRALRIRDGKNLLHTPMRLTDLLHYTIKAISAEERGEIFDALRGGDDAGSAAIIRIVSSKGYDGFVYKNEYEDAGNDSWVIFYTEQAVSAGEPERL